MTQVKTVVSLQAQLTRMESKIDYVVERQRYVDELISEMTPVALQVMGVASDQFGVMEEKGYFAMGRELLAMMDRVLGAYDPEDVGQLGENIVNILDTVRNVTQPDVLAVANEATDVLHHADEVKPVGPFGVMRATGDPDVQRGMAIALEILKHLGKTKGGGEGNKRRAPPAGATAARTRAKPTAAAAPTAAAPKAKSVLSQAVPEKSMNNAVMWEGRRFDASGFLLDVNAWDDDLGQKMAASLDVQLTDDHWTVLRWAREDYLSSGASPNVRRVANGCGLGTRRVYELFPKSPGKTAALIAGIPKPVGCV
ncbi:MAG: TusE/DsrC/DsvC family sulfur relay protein [Kiritimatiellia bacterium]|jgi:TusE/DsrC/DsvC family sulfur relay protein